MKRTFTSLLSLLIVCLLVPASSKSQQPAQKIIVVKACKYPPQGVRGYGPAMASSRWGMSGGDYAKFANENVLVVVIIEQKLAIDNIEEIASVPGIDVLFIGVNDLSFSLGMGGRTNEPIVEEAVNKVLAAGKKIQHPGRLPGGQPRRDQQAHRAGLPLLSGFERSRDDGGGRA